MGNIKSKDEIVKIIQESNIKEEEKKHIINHIKDDSILNEVFFKSLLKALGIKALVEIISNTD
jgi:hypothetical protein